MTVRPGPTRLIDRNRLWAALGKVTLLDARAPGALHRPSSTPSTPSAGTSPPPAAPRPPTTWAPTGCFLPPEELARRYRALGVGDGDTVASCGSGVTACHDIVAMLRAGLPEPILYPGSWSDWCTSGLPYATGSDPGTV